MRVQRVRISQYQNHSSSGSVLFRFRLGSGSGFGSNKQTNINERSRNGKKRQNIFSKFSSVSHDCVSSANHTYKRYESVDSTVLYRREVFLQARGVSASVCTDFRYYQKDVATSSYTGEQSSVFFSKEKTCQIQSWHLCIK